MIFGDFDLFKTIFYNLPMPTITIPKHFSKNEDLVAIPRKEYDRLFARAKNGLAPKEKEMTDEDLLALSREAKQLHKAGKLPLFSDLIKKEYPALAKKHKM